MPIRYEQYNRTAVLTLEADLAGDAPEALRRAAQDVLARRDVESVVIDLDNARFIDSRGLEVLLGIQRECGEKAGQMKLAALDENCRTILELTRLLRRFDCHSDLPAALRAAA